MKLARILSLVVLSVAPPPEPVAIVYALTGTAKLSAPTARPLHRFDRLPPGAAIEVGPASRLALAFTSGARYELGEGSRATLGKTDLTSRAGLVRGLPRVPSFPRLFALADDEQPGPRAGAVRIRSERIGGLYPRHGASILADAAVLRFKPLENGGPYRVEIQNQEGQIVFRVDAEAPPVKVPSQVLLPGDRYGWTVRTLGRAGPVASGGADFVALSKDAARAREALHAALEKEGEGESLALLAEIDRSLGMLFEARQGLQAVQERSPGDASLAEELAAVERQLEDEEVPDDSLEAAREYSALGVIARRKDDLAAAEELYQKAYAIRARLAPESLDLASSHGDLGILAALRGDPTSAEEHFSKALELQQRLAPDSIQVAGTIINLGSQAEARSDLDTAEELFRRAIVLIERLNPDDLELARALSRLGSIEKNRGELALAEEHHRRALAIRQKLALESLEVAGSLQNLGFVAEHRGDFTAAEELLLRALGMREKLRPDSPAVAESFVNLGIIQGLKGDLAKADDYFRRAAEFYERHTPEKLGATKMSIERARIAMELGNLDLAEELYSRALARLEKPYQGSLLISSILEGMGTLSLKRGNLPQAEEFFARTLAIREKVAPDSADVGVTLNDLGQVYRQSRQLAKAADSFCRATEVFDRQRKRLGGTLEERSAFGGTTAEPYRDCLAALVDLGRPEEAFHVLERGRARSFLDLLAERDLRWMDDLPPDLALERKQADAEYDRTLAALNRLSVARDQAQIDDLLVRLRELRAHQEKIAARVRQASPRAAALQDPQPLDLPGAQSVLDSGTVLLTWSVGRNRSFLLVVPQRGKLEVFPLEIGEQALRQRVGSLLNLLRRPDSDRSVIFRQGRELYDLLLRPAEARIAGAKRLLVSPDGPLHTLPFAALVRGGRYLAEDKPVHTILSATVYAELKKSRRERLSAPHVSLAAFGDPSYPPLAPGRSPSHPDVRAAMDRGLTLTPLPSTREEVRDIAALYPQARAFLGAEATEERAKSVGQDARYVHFACHGLLDERFPLNSSLALTIPESPAEGQENGLLQAWEIFDGMRLDADLVTLSACDSALGQEMGGEGLLGLTRAFQYAGARSVLASLWSVSDVSTADLMKRFYGYLRKGRTNDEALRAAQTDLIQSKAFSHPYYWAAFQLTGDWR
jgi:CHAT domain-containing protein/Tfp pilus assembly protein PilF